MHDDVDVIFVDIDVKPVRDEEKVASILICLSNDGHTIRSLRRCATAYAPISEHMVKKIILKLQKLGIVYYDTKSRRWHLTDSNRFESIHDVLEYVRETHLI